MYQVILIFHILAAAAIIGLVLLQQGKGADIGAAFGSGASNTVFGSQGSGGFLFRLTSAMAALFFATSLCLGYIVSSDYKASTQVISKQDVRNKKSADIPIPAAPEKTAESPLPAKSE